MKKKAFITGASGFVGYHVAKLLLEKGYSIRLLIHNKRAISDLLSHPDVEVVTGDILDSDFLIKNTVDCDVVYHAAALYSFNHNLTDLIFETNIKGTENICKAVLVNNIKKMVYTSSAATIGKNYHGLSDETTKFNLWKISGAYKKSKVYAENKVLEYIDNHNLPAVIVNPSVPIGSHDFRPTPTGKMIVNYLLNDKLFCVNGGLNFIHIKDVAMGHYLAEINGKIGERYIIGNANLKMADFYQKLNTITGNNKKIVKIPYLLALLFGMISTNKAKKNNTEPELPKEGIQLLKKQMFYNVEKSKKELKLTLTNIDTAIVESVKWFQENYNV